MANNKKIQPLSIKSFGEENNPEMKNADVKNTPSKILIIRGNCNNDENSHSDNNPLPHCICERKSLARPNWILADYKIIELKDAIKFIEQWNKLSLHSYNEGDMDDGNDGFEKRDATKNDLKINKMKEQLHKYSLEQEWKRKIKRKKTQPGKSEEIPNDNVNSKATCCMKYLQSFLRNKPNRKKTKSPSKIITFKGVTYDKKSGIVNCANHTEITTATTKSDTSINLAGSVKCSKSYIIRKAAPRVTSTQTQVISCSSKAVGTETQGERSNNELRRSSGMFFGVNTKNSSCQTEYLNNENQNNKSPLQSKHFNNQLRQNDIPNNPVRGNCNNYQMNNNCNENVSWKNCNPQISQQQCFDMNRHAPSLDTTCSTFYKNSNFNYSNSNVGIPIQLAPYEGNHQLYNNIPHLNSNGNCFHKNMDQNLPYSYIYSNYPYPHTYIPL